MTEWVVTLRNGQRHDVEAEVFTVETIWPGGQGVRIALGDEGSEPRIWWPAEQVVLVQSRRGHHLEQAWSREG